MEVADNGMVEFMTAGGKVHFRAIDRVCPKIEEPFDALHARRRVGPVESQCRLTRHLLILCM